MMMIDSPSILASPKEIADFLHEYTTGPLKDRPEVKAEVEWVLSYPEMLKDRRELTPADFEELNPENLIRVMKANAARHSAPPK